MPNGRDAFPKPEVAPQDMAWARSAQEKITGAMNDLDSLRTNSLADYKQVNAATIANVNQVSRIRKYLYSIPSTTSKSFSSTVSLPANSWTQVVRQTVPIPAGMTKVTVFTSMSIGLNIGTSDVSTWFSFNAGTGAMESPFLGSIIVTPGQPDQYVKSGHASNSASFTFPKATGGSVDITLSLWSASAINATGQATLTYNIIAGGSL